MVGDRMRNIRLTVAYDGSRYAGFQLQPGRPTVQLKLQEAICAVTGADVKVTGSGRTDAGVHAFGQVVNFYTDSGIPADRWCNALNMHLPDDIVVWMAIDAPLSFHARKSAKRKTYGYTINGNRYPDALHRHLEVHHPAPLDVGAMKSGLLHFIGEHDFTSFSAARSDNRSNVRTIYAAELITEPVIGMGAASGSGKIRLMITGNGFLQHMVRIIVGTLLQIGEGKRSAEDMSGILAARSRSKAGPTAMSHGLMLWDVVY